MEQRHYQMIMDTFIKIVYVFKLSKIDSWDALNNLIDDYTEDYWNFLDFYNNLKPGRKEIGSLR